MAHLLRISRYIDETNKKMGDFAGWLILAMAIVTFIVVILRYFFNLGWVWIQDSVSYMHGASFMLAAAYTLLNNEHVRVDILYQPLSEAKKAKVNIIGTSLLLFPFCFLIWFYGFEYVANSWAVFEGSKETGGLGGVYIVKSLVIIFPTLLFLQGVSEIIKAVEIIKKSGDLQTQTTKQVGPDV
ncbi:MAG: TRAP transporter small permease subunit [SAR324 cluster bacterium]|nr:TRAP transporter small permease subunit [SAR324 cluster bacterium]